MDKTSGPHMPDTSRECVTLYSAFASVSTYPCSLYPAPDPSLLCRYITDKLDIAGDLVAHELHSRCLWVLKASYLHSVLMFPEPETS